LTTRDTVMGETFASRATASIVTAWPLRRSDFFVVFFNARSPRVADSGLRRAVIDVSAAEAN
jgi:hypothetical protein